jgi:hypothetical protein
MYWLDVQEHFNDLVVGTYGRGVWILDDLTPLQQLPDNFSATKAALFNPKDAYRFQPKTSTMQFFPEPSTGFDPPYGASINYWLNSDKDSVKLYITSASGDTLKTFKQKGKAGINRVWWDLQGKATKDIWMRTHPTAADWVALDKNRKRPAFISNPFRSYLATPGKYNVSMTVGDQKFSSSLTVLKDPNSEGSLADIQAQTEWLAKIQADYDQGGKMVNEVESIRRQLYDLRDVLGSKGSSMKKLVESVSKLDSTLTLVEGKLVQLKYTGTGQDDVRYPDMLLGKFGYLAGAIATADFPPADQHKAVYAELKKRLTDIQAEFDRVLKTDVAALLQLLNENKIQPIVTGMK